MRVEPVLPPPLPEFVMAFGRNRSWPETKGADANRRGMYIHLRRNVPYPMLTTFDASDASVACLQRERSNSPLQALTLLNDPVFFSAAGALADRLAALEGDIDRRLRAGFELCLGRTPSAAELQALRRRRDTLPEATRARELETELGALDTRLVAARTEVADRTLELRKAEADVEQVVNRAKRDQERLTSGEVKAAKDLEALQHELVSLAKRQAELEDTELEAMQRVEDAQSALEQLDAQRGLLLTEQAAVRSALERLLAEIQGKR